MLSALLFALQEAAPVREWWVRAAARDPAAEERELLSALESSAWRERAHALDALERSTLSGGGFPDALEARVWGALEDEHPNVRARALAVLGGLGPTASLEPELAASLSAEPLATVRLALARSLAHVPCARAPVLLASLARDEDERVAEAARAALLALDPAQPGALAQGIGLVERVARDGRPGEFLELVEVLARCVPARELLLGARARIASVASVATADVARRALVEALCFARGAGGDGALVIAGWPEEAPRDPRALVLFLAARSGERELAREALRGAELRGPGSPLGRELARFALEILGEDEVLGFLREHEPPPELLAVLLEELGPRLPSWDEAAAEPWTRPAVPVPVRRALLEALAGGPATVSDPACARLLARFLDGPEPGLAARAFEVLCGARRSSDGVDEKLRAAWERCSSEERARRLAWFTRERPLAPFRDAWIALGARGDESRRVACELLAPFEGDPEARAALGGWLSEDLRRLAAARAVERELEFLLQGELRALARVAREGEVQAYETALLGSLAKESEIGEIAAAALGGSEAGRARLAALLAAKDLAADGARRTRIEAAIALASRGTIGQESLGVEHLIRDRSAAAWDLRERMLRALGGAEDERASAELVRLALDPRLEPVERTCALELLAAGRSDAGIEGAAFAARADLDLETRRAALRALGKIGGERAGAHLARLLDDLAEGRLAAGADEAPLLRGELLEALGACGRFSEELDAAWLSGPREAAPEDLRARCSGAELSATEFTWRSEILLARALARAGRASAALARSGEWWRCDARLLLALGEALAAEPAARGAARELLAAGLTGLQGERDPDPALRARARSALLLLDWEGGAWERAGRLARALLAARAAGEVSDELWGRLSGTPGRTTLGDADARVASLLWQARARAALERGDLGAAGRAAERAARELGGSPAAAREQRRLQADLGRALEAASGK